MAWKTILQEIGSSGQFHHSPGDDRINDPSYFHSSILLRFDSSFQLVADARIRYNIYVLARFFTNSGQGHQRIYHLTQKKVAL